MKDDHTYLKFSDELSEYGLFINRSGKLKCEILCFRDVHVRSYWWATGSENMLPFVMDDFGNLTETHSFPRG